MRSPLIEGAVHHIYEYQGWRIRAEFLQLDGPVVRIDYQKILAAGINPTIQDYELQAIASANTPFDSSWKQLIVKNPALQQNAYSTLVGAYFAEAIGEKMWQRSDGAILWLRSQLVVRLELPAAREYEEQLRVANEQRHRLQCRSSDRASRSALTRDFHKLRIA